MYAHIPLAIVSIWMLAHILSVSSYSTGAPDSTCDTMLPGHPDPGNVGPPPFELVLSKTSFRPGEKINVTIRRTDGKTFRGFLIQARRRSGTDPEKIGSFTILNSSVAKLNCISLCTKWSDCSVTHKDGSDKMSIELAWTAPCDLNDHGDITFRTTFVEKKFPSVFWHDIPLANLTADTPNGDECQGTTVSTETAPTMTPLPPIDLNDCGTKKGCYRTPSNCGGIQDCDYLLTWANQGDRINFFISAKATNSEKWTALGLSLDQKMGADSVTDCIYDEATHSMIIQSSWNDNTPNNVVLTDKQLGLVPGSTRGSYADSILQCEFTRYILNNHTTSYKADYHVGPPMPMMTSLLADNIYDLTQQFYLFLGKGLASAGIKSPHAVTPVISPEEVYLNGSSYVNIGGMTKFPLVITHGAMMIFAWMLCASVGVLMPRYFKTAWKEVTIFDKAVWFQIHRPLMSIVLILTCCGFIVIFVDVGGYAKHLTKADAAHPILGIIVTALVIVNPIMAIFRPHPNTPNRPIFNAAHFTVGTVAHVSAAVTMFLGTRLSKARMSSWAQWIVLGFAIWHTIVEIVLAVHQWNMQNSRTLVLSANKTSPSQSSVDVNSTERSSGNEYTPKGSVPATPSTVDLLDGSMAIIAYEKSASIFKTVVIGFHFCVILGCSLTLVVDLAS